MDNVTITIKGKEFELALIPLTYKDGNIAIQAMDTKDGIAWGVLTVNAPHRPLGGPNRSAIKTYSENKSWADQVLTTLVERGDCKVVGEIDLPYDTVPVVEWKPFDSPIQLPS